ncbi:cytochrome P450 81Q32-like [Andrographis paniculata]|uniref:cytochrome P450 81Q32-like n=1 Tax=Andrographis paniculata TaxID=175694 RepID=UPI0021E775AE|nr:cytochrome P450 81Q32-like [Andrographis paniculata]
MELPWLLYASLFLAIYLSTKHFFNRLRNLPPSPFLSLPFIGHLYLAKKPLYRALAKVAGGYGPVVLLQLGSRRVLVVSSPEAAEECLARNDVVFANRPDLLAGKHLGYNYTSLAWSSYGDHWRNLRKISSIEILSAHRLDLLRDIRAGEVRSLIGALNRAAEQRRPVDMKTAFFELTMNVMMRMIAGKRYYGENVVEVEEARRFREITTETLRIGSSNIGDFLPVVKWLGLGGVEKALMELQRKRNVFMQELLEGCRKRFAGEAAVGKAKTMIDMLLAFEEKEPENCSDAFIRSLMLTLLIAGTDTSAGTMEWALSLLVKNSGVLKKAQAEIDGRIGHDRLIDETDVSDLPYLRCIINETLRLYPAGPLLIPHASSEACTVGGYRVPAGTMLLVNIWAIQNDPKQWEDAGKFRPERFEGVQGSREGFRLMPFGSGRRGCPGEGLALRMLGFGLGALIQCFDWEAEGPIDMSEGTGLTLPRATPLMAVCRARPVAEKILSQI